MPMNHMSGLSPPQARISLGAVRITPRTRELMAEALEQGTIGQGPQVAEFEAALAAWLGVRHAVATANGTTADAVALAAVRALARRRANHRELASRIGQGGLREEAEEWIVPHGYPLMVASAARRDELLAELPERYGIEARQIFSSVPTQCEAYAYLGEPHGRYPVAEDTGARGLYVPCHQNLSTEDLGYLVDVMCSVLT